MKIKNFSEVKSFFLDNKDLKQTILKNTFWLFFAQAFARLVSLIIVIWSARYFGPEIYGKFSFSFSFVALFIVFTDFGMSNLIMREVAKDKSKTSQYIDNMFFLKIILAVIILPVIVILIHFIRNDPETLKLVYFLGVYVIINSFSSFFESIFMGNEKMQYAATCVFLGDLFLLFFVCLFILNGLPILTISYAYIISAVAETFLAIILVWHYFAKFFLKISFKICKEIFMDVWPFGLMAVFVSTYYYFNSVILGISRSNQEVGWYNAAFKTAFFTISISGIIFMSFFPSISRSFKKNAEKFRSAYNRYATVTFIIGTPLGFGGFLVAPELIKFLYQEPYHNAILPFQILVWGVSLNFLCNTYCNCLLACDEQKKALKAVTMGVAFSVLMNLILIPIYGIIGAAIVLPFTELLVLIVAHNELKKIIKTSFFKLLTYPLIASLMMSIFLIIFKKVGISSPILLIIFGAAVYFSAFYFLFRANKLKFLKFIYYEEK